MKKFSGLFIFLLCLSFTACDLFGGKDVTFSSQDLIGTWLEDGTQAYVCFTTEWDDSKEYQYGYEWDEADDVHREDLIQHGNGWFKWKLLTNDLNRIEFMDYGWADIPKVYTIEKLTNTQLIYRDNYKVQHTFSKQ
ncbi:MAG: hypothetical protein MJZ92_01295 [Paludibacteraceae bacterium]|nr:hypothetical protein [Paludibacteraceae bacterium]